MTRYDIIVLTPKQDHVARHTGLIFPDRVPVLRLAGDMKTCDTCTLASSCTKFQAGGDCRMTQNDRLPVAITEMFLPEKPETLLLSLGNVLNAQAQRVNEQMEQERNEDDPKEKRKLSEKVDRNLNNLLKNGLTLAKQLDRMRPDTGKRDQPPGTATVGGGLGQVANAIRALENDHGFLREEITPAMARAFIDGGIDAVRSLDRTGGLDARTQRDVRDVF